MTVIISPNIKRERVSINPNGDIIDKNKNIIVPNVQEKVDIEDIKALETKRNENPQTNATPMDIQKQIEDAEKHLESLKKIKAEKIAEMKKQLEMLES